MFIKRIVLWAKEHAEAAALMLALCSFYFHITSVLYASFVRVGGLTGLTSDLSNPGRLCCMIGALALCANTNLRRILLGMGIGVVGGKFLACRVSLPILSVLSYDQVYCILLCLWVLQIISFTSFRVGDKVHEIALVIGAGWYIILRPVTIALHYSAGVQDFAFPLVSRLKLIAIIAGAPILVATFLVLVSGDRLKKTPVLPIVAAFAWGVCLIPMYSADNGWMNYSSNILIRMAILLLLMITIPLLVNKISIVLKLYVFVTFGLELLMIVLNGNRNVTTAHETVEHPDMPSVLCNAKCVHSNNVYLLVYDGYPSSVTCEGLGIDRGGIDEFLAENGFVIYPNMYSVGNNTLPSMVGMFELGGITYGSLRSVLAGNNIFCDKLKGAGYRQSFILSGFMMPMRGDRMPGDYYFPKPGAVVKPEDIIMGCILRGYISQSPQVFDAYSTFDWSKAKYDAMNTMKLSSEFIYAHQDLPGHRNFDPMKRKTDAYEQREHAKKMAEANQAIRGDVDYILNVKKDKEAIIIFASDHGGVLLHPEKSSHYPDSACVADIYGCNLAIRWPRDYAAPRTITCLQNCLLEVFVYLTGESNLRNLSNIGETQKPPRDKWGGVTPGYVRKGMVQTGPDKGRTLYEAARDAYKHIKADSLKDIIPHSR